MARPPNVEQLKEIAHGFGLRLDEEAARSFVGLIEGTLSSYARLDQLAEPELVVK